MAANKACLMRLGKEYQRLGKDPLPDIDAEPRPNNILEWHFVIKGPADTPYSGGHYHGTLVFPPEYPYKPPAIMLLTPNGRFTPNTRLCLSMSDFHPETWVPAWSVASILNGVLSFMLEEGATVGSVEPAPSTAERRRLARCSHAFNRKTPLFCELFPSLVMPEDALPEDTTGPAAGAEEASGGRVGGEAAGAGGGLHSPLVVGLAMAACVVAGLAFLAQQ